MSQSKFFYLSQDQKNFLHYEVIPNVVPVTTLFIHGNLASNRWWGPLLHCLPLETGGKKDGHIILAEIRGCGQSSDISPDDKISISSLSDDFVGLIKDLNVKKINLIGHSTGGTIVLLILSRISELVNRAILINAVGVHGRQYTPEMAKIFQRMKTDINLVADVMRPTISASEIDPQFFKNVIVQDAFRAAQGVGIKIAQSFGEFEMASEVTKISTPVLVLHSDKDQILPLSDAQELARLLPNSQLEVLTNIGHCPNLQDPKGLWLKLSQFLNVGQ